MDAGFARKNVKIIGNRNTQLEAIVFIGEEGSILMEKDGIILKKRKLGIGRIENVNIAGGLRKNTSLNSAASILFIISLLHVCLMSLIRETTRVI